MEELTKTQAKTLEAVKKLIERNGIPPTLREIRDERGLSSISTVSVQLNALAKKGYITYRPGRMRTIRIIKEWRG